MLKIRFLFLSFLAITTSLSALPMFSGEEAKQVVNDTTHNIETRTGVSDPRSLSGTSAAIDSQSIQRGDSADFSRLVDSTANNNSSISAKNHTSTSQQAVQNSKPSVMDKLTSYFAGPKIPSSLLKQADSNSAGSQILKPLLAVGAPKTPSSSFIGRFECREVNQVVGSSSSYQPPAVPSEALSAAVRSEVPLHIEQVSTEMPSGGIAEASEFIESIPTTAPELSLVDRVCPQIANF